MVVLFPPLGHLLKHPYHAPNQRKRITENQQQVEETLKDQPVLSTAPDFTRKSVLASTQLETKLTERIWKGPNLGVTGLREHLNIPESKHFHLGSIALYKPFSVNSRSPFPTTNYTQSSIQMKFIETHRNHVLYYLIIYPSCLSQSWNSVDFTNICRINELSKSSDGSALHGQNF